MHAHTLINITNNDTNNTNNNNNRSNLKQYETSLTCSKSSRPQLELLLSGNWYVGRKTI